MYRTRSVRARRDASEQLQARLVDDFVARFATTVPTAVRQRFKVRRAGTGASRRDASSCPRYQGLVLRRRRRKLRAERKPTPWASSLKWSHMKFSSDTNSMIKALRAIARRHPSRPKRDADMVIKASADGVVFETNLSSAFVPAQVAVAGTCLAPRDAITRVLATYPRNVPLTIEVVDRQLCIGRLQIPVPVHFDSKENTAYRR